MIENKEHINNYKLYKDISDIILFDGKGYEKSIGFDHKLLIIYQSYYKNDSW